jgi:hypothetical protein
MTVDEEVQKIRKRVAEEFLNDSRERKAFFESEEFMSLFGIIGEQGYLNQNDLKYSHVKIDGLDSNSFGRLCDCVFDNFEPSAAKKENPSVLYVDYKNIRFNLFIGQGSNYWTERLK